MISSKYPIYLNANVYTKFNDSNNSNNEYSPVYTTADNKSKTITDYIASAKDLSCTLDASIYSYTKKMHLLYIMVLFIKYHLDMLIMEKKQICGMILSIHMVVEIL